jgi:hypothetical protein
MVGSPLSAAAETSIHGHEGNERLLDMTSEFVPRVSLAGDVSHAAWLAHTALERGVASSFVPTGLEAYVQVLHPAATSHGEPVRWREVADWLHAPLLPGVWFQDLEELAGAMLDSDRPWAHAPLEGEIPDAVLDQLALVLAGHTTSEHGWFCLWDGWGFMTGSMTRTVAWPEDRQPPPGTPSRFRSRPAFPREVRKSSKVHLPTRDYFLFEGPLVAVNELGAFVTWEPGEARSFECQTPSLWWPDDLAWCAGNEVDSSFTCIGGSRDLINELLAHPDLEVLELHPTVEFSPYSNLHDNKT